MRNAGYYEGKTDEEILVCGLLNVSVSPGDAEVRFTFPPGHCCDMYGAIHLAERYLPEVKRVFTHAPGDRYSDSRGTIYFRRPEGWHAQGI
jgi:hypothetical protein